MVMPTNVADPAAPATGGVPAPAAGGTGGLPDYEALSRTAQAEAAEWQRRFAGMQSLHQKESDEWKKTSTLAAESQAALQAITGQKLDLEQKLGATSATLEQKQAELLAANTRLAITDMIIAKFPHLVQFMDVLPTAGTVEELEPKLKTFSDRLAEFGKAGTGEYKAGQTPSSPTPKEPGKSDDILRQAMDAASKGDMVLYNKLYSEYIQTKPAKEISALQKS